MLTRLRLPPHLPHSSPATLLICHTPHLPYASPTILLLLTCHSSRPPRPLALLALSPLTVSPPLTRSRLPSPTPLASQRCSPATSRSASMRAAVQPYRTMPSVESGPSSLAPRVRHALLQAHAPHFLPLLPLLFQHGGQIGTHWRAARRVGASPAAAAWHHAVQAAPLWRIRSRRRPRRAEAAQVSRDEGDAARRHGVHPGRATAVRTGDGAQPSADRRVGSGAVHAAAASCRSRTGGGNPTFAGARVITSTGKPVVWAVSSSYFLLRLLLIHEAVCVDSKTVCIFFWAAQ